MPAVLFRVRWPDGGVETFYSPSMVIKGYFQIGKPYALAEFLDLCRDGLHAASERVRQRYGYNCPLAMAQLEAIEVKAKQMRPDASVQVEGFQA